MDGDTTLKHFRCHNGHLTLVAATLVETEDAGEEIVVGPALVRSVVMALTRQMDILQLIAGSIESIYILKERIFECGNGRCPVASIADNLQRTRREERNQLGIARSSARKLDGFSALAGTAAVEMACEVDRWGSRRYTVVEDGEEYGVGAAARPAVDTDAVMIDVTAVIPHIIE